MFLFLIFKEALQVSKQINGPINFIIILQKKKLRFREFLIQLQQFHTNFCQFRQTTRIREEALFEK